MQKYSSTVLRIGIGLVIIYFSSQQFINPSSWISFLPSWTTSLPISQIQFVYLNAYFELIFGILLIIGFYIRIVAALLTLHMLGIVLSIGYNPTGMRDFGIFIALLSISLHEVNHLSVDKFFISNLNSQDPQSAQNN